MQCYFTHLAVLFYVLIGKKKKNITTLHFFFIIIFLFFLHQSAFDMRHLASLLGGAFSQALNKLEAAMFW